MCTCCPAFRRYVHIYQQKLDALQPKANAAEASAESSTAERGDSSSTALPAVAAAAAAAAADGSLAEGSAALQMELQRLEQELCVEDILLCRSLAELALERRSSSSGGAVYVCRWRGCTSGGFISCWFVAALSRQPLGGKAFGSLQQHPDRSVASTGMAPNRSAGAAAVDESLAVAM